MRLLFHCERIESTKVTVHDGRLKVGELLLTEGGWRGIELTENNFEHLILEFSALDSEEEHSLEFAKEYAYDWTPKYNGYFDENDEKIEEMISCQLQYPYNTEILSSFEEISEIMFIPEGIDECDGLIYFVPFIEKDKLLDGVTYIRKQSVEEITCTIKKLRRSGNILAMITVVVCCMLIPLGFGTDEPSLLNGIGDALGNHLSSTLSIWGIIGLIAAPVMLIATNQALPKLKKFLLSHPNL